MLSTRERKVQTWKWQGCRERNKSRKLWWGLSSHMVMRGHVCGDVFDMCWAHRGAVWLKLQQEADLHVSAAAAAAAAGQHSSIKASAVSVCIRCEETWLWLLLVYMSPLHMLWRLSVWLTIPAAARLLQETGSRSWTCLVQGDASAFLDTQNNDTQLLESIHVTFFHSKHRHPVDLSSNRNAPVTQRTKDRQGGRIRNVFVRSTCFRSWP